MKVIRYSDRDFSDQVAGLSAHSSLFDRGVEDNARAIIGTVSSGGDQAVVDLIARFGGPLLTPEQLPVTQAEFVTASLKVDESVRDAVASVTKNVELFSRKALRKNWSIRNSHGAVVGEKFDPFCRVGIYVPGGTAPLASTALMTVLLARVAGCKEIVVCTPCNKSGSINDALLYAIRAAGATEVYRVGGAQAVAAMALGTPTIRRVQKIFGPGNAYVVAAKRLLFGHVAIDLLPGPSEVLVLADETADAAFVAADLLAQAEHGSGHERTWLITPSRVLIKSVEKEMAKQLPKLSRRAFIEKALAANCALVQVRSMEQGIALCNELAPEHCEVMAKNNRKIADQITTAGAIFLGPFSPTVLGDYVAGPSHTLPTGGAGRSFAGLTVDQFQRRTSVVQYDRASLKRALPTVRKFAELEGLDAHGKSAEIRFPKARK